MCLIIKIDFAVLNTYIMILISLISYHLLHPSRFLPLSSSLFLTLKSFWFILCATGFNPGDLCAHWCGAKHCRMMRLLVGTQAQLKDWWLPISQHPTAPSGFSGRGGSLSALFSCMDDYCRPSAEVYDCDGCVIPRRISHPCSLSSGIRGLFLWANNQFLNHDWRLHTIYECSTKIRCISA